MALTRDFKETIRARVERDPKFRKELLREGIECMLAGDIATAKTILRDYINSTVGFVGLADATKIPSKSLMRMLGPAGNPRAGNLFVIVSFLQNHEGMSFRLTTKPGRSSTSDPSRPRQSTRAKRSQLSMTRDIRTLSPPEWIRDSWSRDPDKGDVLFLTPEQWQALPKEEQGPWPANACLHHQDSEERSTAYACGYQRAAQLLAEYAVRQRHYQDLLIYPIVFLYRHSVELFLKKLIPVAADLVDQPLRKDEEQLLTNTHKIDKLWSIFKPRLMRMRANGYIAVPIDLEEGIASYVSQLSRVDEHSFSFRYSASKDGTPTLSDYQYINIMRITVLLEPFVSFFAGLDEMINEQYQVKREYMWEAQQHALGDSVYEHD